MPVQPRYVVTNYYDVLSTCNHFQENRTMNWLKKLFGMMDRSDAAAERIATAAGGRSDRP